MDVDANCVFSSIPTPIKGKLRPSEDLRLFTSQNGTLQDAIEQLAIKVIEGYPKGGYGEADAGAGREF